MGCTSKNNLLLKKPMKRLQTDVTPKMNEKDIDAQVPRQIPVCVRVIE